MTCPRCSCPECRRVEPQAVLAKFVSRETIEPSADEHNARVLQDMREREQWRDTFIDPHGGMRG